MSVEPLATSVEPLAMSVEVLAMSVEALSTSVEALAMSVEAISMSFGCIVMIVSTLASSIEATCIRDVPTRLSRRQSLDGANHKKGSNCIAAHKNPAESTALPF
jgi:hypothetical protein